MFKKGQKFISDRGTVVIIERYVQGFSITYRYEESKNEYTLNGSEERFLNVFKPLEVKRND